MHVMDMPEVYDDSLNIASYESVIYWTQDYPTVQNQTQNSDKPNGQLKSRSICWLL